MKKQDSHVDIRVQVPKPEKMYYVVYGEVRRHSRVLYLPLDTKVVRFYKIKKGDTIKFSLLELRRTPEDDEEVE